MENRKRNHRFLVSLTEKEMSELMKKVDKTGLSRNTYIRMLINNIQPKEKPEIDFYETLKILRQISINMNQIAVKANTIGFIDVNAYWDNSQKVMDAVGELKQKMT